MKWPSALLPALLLVTSVLCDKKLNLDDIERDQLRTDSSLSSKKLPAESLRGYESKYAAAKAEVGKSYSQKQQHQQQQRHQQQQQQQYHAPTAASQELGNQVGDYTELQSYESFRYAPAQQNDYSQEKYQDNEDASAYLQQNALLANSADHQHQQQQQQYYIQEGRGNSQNGYEVAPQHQQQQQQHLYQQEVLVGNQLQTSQQKAAAQKYIDAGDEKGTYYVNIPTSQLLAYYQNYGIAQPKSKNADQQISIPVYMPLLAQNQVYTPTKVTYQPELQYVSAYPKHTEAVFTKTAKSPSAAAPSLHATAATTSRSAAHQEAVAQQEYAPLDLLMNSAYAAAYQPQSYLQYVAQPQQQQQQQYVHETQQQIVYADNPTAYAGIYNAAPSAYVQENSLYEQQQPQQQQQQYYVPAAFAEQFMAQILHHAGIHGTDVKQDVAQQEAVQHDFTPPQYQAQNFRGSHDVTHLVPVSNENEGSPAKSAYSSASSAASQPKTLLDSYVPSHVIAAQDAHRYRERPIKLESGFLPSKINFVRSYKKRKTE